MMNDLNWYLINKDHDFIHNGPTPVIGKPTTMHLIGINPPPQAAGPSVVPDDKLNKLAKIKPSMSRERVGLNPN